MTTESITAAIWLAESDEHDAVEIRDALIRRLPDFETRVFSDLASLREGLRRETPVVILVRDILSDGKASNLLNDPLWAAGSPIIVMSDRPVDPTSAESTVIEPAARIDTSSMVAEKIPRVVAEILQQRQTQDYTARTLEALRQSESRYRSLIEESIQGIIIHQRYKPVLVNRAYAEILGYDSPDEVLALPDIRSTYALHEHDRMGAWQKARMSGGEAPSNYEYSAVRKDGQMIRLQTIVRRVDWYGKSATQHSVIDVTSRAKDKKALRDSEQRFKDYASASSDFFWEMDEDLRFSWFSDRFTEVTGVPTGALLGRTRQETPIPGIDKRLWWKHLANLRERRPFRNFVHPRQKPDGDTVWVSISGVPVFDESGRFRGFRGAGSDVTRLVETTQRLEREERRFRALYDNNPCMFFTLDAKGRVLSMNRYATEQLGFAENEVVGKPIAKLYPESERHGVKAAIARCLNREGGIERWETSRMKKDGTTFWVIETARCVHNADGESEILMVCEDVTEIHDLSRKLAHQAAHDKLTGLVNRKEFEHRLGALVEETPSETEEHAVLYIDLDQFKVVNDTCGHEAGDKLLLELTQVLGKHIRKHDTLARLGGDEFGVVLERCPLARATEIAERIRNAIQEFQFVWNKSKFSLGASIGVVSVAGTWETAGDVLTAADNACYLAKENGRNRLHIYDDQDDAVLNLRGTIKWVTRIEEAFEDDRFTLYYQPIIANGEQGHERIHIELLLRLIEEDGTTISPAIFLPAAERYNLSARIDRWVVKNALSWLEKDERLLERIETCAINLSGISIGDEAFLKFLTGELSRTRVPGEKICFEITETAAISNVFKAMHFMRELKQFGCRFALDDFGSGFSSFAYLKSLPVDFLKIDGAFIQDMVEDNINLAMVKSINDIGHVMGKRTVAEFVCNEKIREALGDLSVDFLQGYALGKPRPIESLASSNGRSYVA